MNRVLVAVALILIALGAIGTAAWSPYWAVLFLAGAGALAAAAR
jgi:hypothetical protein